MISIEFDMKVSIVIPAKNEAKSLVVLLPALSALSVVSEIIVVNDGSTDSTAEICESNGVKLISHPVSKGNGASIKAGARAASGDVIVFMDGDGQHQPCEIPKLLSRYKEGYDLVVGSRDAKGQASWFRCIANGLYNRFATWVTGHKVEDLTSGFRVVSAKKFREFLYMLPNGFSYPTTSTMAFFRSGYSVAYEPVEVLKREGESHINLIKDGLRFFLIIFKVGTLFSPLRIFIPIAFLMFLIASGWYAFTFYSSSSFTNMSALLYSGSVMIFLMGLISEQITSLMYKDTGR